MKTAISIEDKLFKDAEKFAKTYKLSRSELYQRALRQYLTDAQQIDITNRLNSIYANEPAAVPPRLAKAQAKTIQKHNEAW